MAAASDTSYKVGSLSALLTTKVTTSGSENGKEDEESPANTLTSLFKSRSTLPPPKPVKAAALSQDPSEPPNKKKAKKRTDKDKKAKNDDDDDDKDEQVYTTPSRKFQVTTEATKEKKLDPEKEARTVFVGNLPSSVTTKAIKRRFKEFGEVETVRLRNVARPDLTTTKKLAVIKRKIHEKRHNINAYIRFKSKDSAVKSCELNGSDFESHVIRVDLADAASAGKKTDESGKVVHDQSKSVFLGNLPFSIEEDAVREHFKVCGEIVDVRLIRDSFTGMGKGFGYVNFQSSESIELGLRLNGSKLEGREIRVSRSTNKPKQKMVMPSSGGKGKGQVFKNTSSSQQKQQQQRAPLKKKFMNKPKVEFQGKVGLNTRERKAKQKQIKKAKKFGGGHKKKPAANSTSSAAKADK